MRLHVHLFALAITALVLSAGCILEPEPGEACGDATTCYLCQQLSGCGFCAETERCVAGSSLGPSETSCRPADWRFANCYDPPPTVSGCARYDDCRGCADGNVGSFDCHYCFINDRCQHESEPCPGGGLGVTSRGLCNDAECAAHTDCSSCQTAACEWCDEGGGSCLDGSSGCDFHHVINNNDSCPPPNNCTSHLSCGACTGDANCGWCSLADGYCASGDSEGSYSGNCSGTSWIWRQSGCP